MMAWTLADTLPDYDANWPCDPEIGRFQDMASRGIPLADAIRIAAESKNEWGGVYDHQRKNWNFWPDSIRRAMVILPHAEGEFRQCRDFDEIHDLVKGLIWHLEGLKELYCYDVAVRIGAYLGRLPERVYLHAGTREGAKLLGLPEWRKSLEMSELPEALRQRSPWEVENILCHHAKCCRQQQRQLNRR